MAREILYTWRWSELHRLKWAITKKVFEGERCVLTCELDPVPHPQHPCGQADLAKLFNETLEEFDEP